MRRKLLVGNWKMNGDLARNAALLAVLRAAIGARGGDGGRDPGGGIGVDTGVDSGIDTGVDIAVCAPAPYLAQCQAELADSAIRWGAQDVSVHCVGAYTGEVSAAMLREFGCSFVIVGHSERRAYHGEGNGLVAKKAAQALHVGLTPIVCVGETLSERETGLTDLVVGGQVEAVVSVLDAEALSRIVIAYEPVWAIGTGVTATPGMAQEMHAQIRMRLAARHPRAAAATRILYGGSMKPDNAADLLAMPDIDGGLIGGASLTAADFLAIVGQAHAGEGCGAGGQASD